jgi:outer membrane lipoprotein-sorting protein
VKKIRKIFILEWYTSKDIFNGVQRENMPILLLAQGDQTAKDLLRQAIKARYGLRPLALDSLKIDFKGRAKVKVGPVSAWVPVDTTAYFHFPTAMRWDFTAKPLKLPVQRGVEAYDGNTYRSVRGGKIPATIDDSIQVSAMRKRLWAVASVMLTPLSDLFVKLETTGEFSLRATNTHLDDFADIFLRDDYTVEHVRVHCFNADTEAFEDFIIRVDEEQTTINELLIPAKMTMLWNDRETFELTPAQIEVNPTISPEVFRIEDETVY